QRPFEPAFVGVPQLVEREVRRAEAVVRLGGHAADAREGNIASARDLVDRAALAGAGRNDDTRLRLAEERGVQSQAEVGAGRIKALAASEAHLGQCDGEPAVRAVM